MGGRPASNLSAPASEMLGALGRLDATAQASVRTYLRLLVEAPVRDSDDFDEAEEAFVAVVADWAETNGVDRRTLVALGVPRRVLDRAGARTTPAAEVVRRCYPAGPFTVAGLMGRSGISESTVRKTLVEDEHDGRIERVGSFGRTVQYRVT